MIVPSTDGVEIAVHDLGGAGPFLLISHATGFHGHCYEPIAHALADRFHTIAFDYRGHGDTDRPDVPIEWRRYGDDAEAIAVWLVEQNHGRPIDAFGHSMGGACLLMAASRRPTLFRRLVLFEPIVTLQSVRTDAGDSPMVVAARRRRATFPSYQAAIDNYASKPPLNSFTPDALRAYVLHGFSPDDEGVHLKCRPDTEATTFEQGAVHDTWDLLPAIETDVLVVAGRVEEFQPSQIAARVAERLPHGRYLELDQLDHFGPMTRPLLVADLIAEEISRT
jgi:pimeloyl-ACP methyl ester carboxylesterase